MPVVNNTKESSNSWSCSAPWPSRPPSSSSMHEWSSAATVSSSFVCNDSIANGARKDVLTPLGEQVLHLGLVRAAGHTTGSL
eukprot:8885126-Prorocentrum_lima.AAC.1